MPGQLRPNMKAAKIAYTLLKTPKDLQQENQKKPPKMMVEGWFKDSLAAQ